MNDALEKRAQIQIHLNAVVKSLEEAQYSAKKEADENTQHTFSLMTALENIDNLKNGKQDVPGAREKIEAFFKESENELHSASQLMLEYQDQTEIRVWIEKTLPGNKPCFSSPKPIAYSSELFLNLPEYVNSLFVSSFVFLFLKGLMKTTRTKRTCPSEDQERIMCCAINPFRPVLVCGLENGKLCLFQEEDDCDFIPFSDWKATIVETLSTNLVACVDWDVSKICHFPLLFTGTDNIRDL